MGFAVVIILILGLAVIIFYLSKIDLKQTATKYMLLSYMSILVLSFGFYEMVLSKQEMITIEPEDIHFYEKENNKFFELLNEGKFSKIDKEYVYKQTKIEFSYDKLLIATNRTEDFYGASVYIEKKDVDDNFIDVIHYRTKPNIDNIDVFEIEPLKYHWNKHTLTFEIPEEVKFKLNRIKKEFPIVQFSGNEKRDDLDLMHLTNIEALYLRVPKSVEISHSDYIYVDIIGEE